MSAEEVKPVRIPAEATEFAKELSALCRKHNLYKISGEFRLDMRSAWSEPVAFSWEMGRHGEDGFQVTLTSQFRQWVKANV